MSGKEPPNTAEIYCCISFPRFCCALIPVTIHDAKRIQLSRCKMVMQYEYHMLSMCWKGFVSINEPVKTGFACPGLARNLYKHHPTQNKTGSINPNVPTPAAIVSVTVTTH